MLSAIFQIPIYWEYLLDFEIGGSLRVMRIDLRIHYASGGMKSIKLKDSVRAVYNTGIKYEIDSWLR